VRPFKTKVDIIAGDKASIVIAKITTAAQKMAKGVTQSAQIAGKAFTTFSARAGMAAKKAAVTLNNLNAGVNGFFRRIGKGLGTLGTLGLGIGFLSLASVIVDANMQVDASFASLSAITGKTGKEFDAFKTQVTSVAKAQTLFTGNVAKAFEIVASAKPELLANADALAKVTNAAITLSKASGDDLAQSSLNLAGVMNQFNLQASEADRVMNSLAAGSVAGSANITNVAASMKNFGAVAAGANISMEQSVALVEVLGSKSIFAEEAGTALRGTILRLQAAGVGYASGQFKINDALVETKMKLDKLSTARKKDAYLQKVFGARNIISGKILLDNIGMFDNMTKAVTGTNMAVTQMNTKANTFQNRLQEIKDSFKNSVTATDAQAGAMQKLKDVMAFVAKNMDTIINYAIKGIEAFLAFKVAVYGLRVATTAYNIAVGIQAGLLKKANIAMKTNLTAIKAMNITTKIATGVQWLFNAALWTNPVTWIVVGILALIAAIAALIIYWEDIVNWLKTSDSWFAKLIRGAIYPLIILFRVMGGIINWVSEKISQFINWIKTSDNWFAKFLRTAIELLGEFWKMLGWVSEKISQFVEWIKTSDNWFAKFLRTAIELLGEFWKMLGWVWDKIVGLMEGAIEPLIDAFERIGQVIDMFSEGTQKELGVDVSKTLTLQQRGIDPSKLTPEQMGISAKIDPSKLTPEQMGISAEVIQKKKAEDDLIKSLNLNSTELDKNTRSQQKQWTGKFRTTILKDLNLAGSTGVQKDLAIAAVSNEINNSSVQNDIVNNGKVPDKVVTPGGSSKRKNNKNVNGTITINVVNKTGGKFGLQIEGSGVNVVTTGNQ
jgi:TP901 family phage tail tape measure protein